MISWYVSRVMQLAQSSVIPHMGRMSLSIGAIQPTSNNFILRPVKQSMTWGHNIYAAQPRQCLANFDFAGSLGLRTVLV